MADIICRVCQMVKRKEQLRKTSRGRTIKHCVDCRGLLRCIHCGVVKESRTFKTHAGNRNFHFADGEEIRIAVCYGCDYKKNKDRYTRYDRKVHSATEIKYVVMTNIQRWKARTIDSGLVFDLTRKYLVDLWSKQGGRCYYSGMPIDILNDRGGWNGPSLDRIDPSKGYVIGNVIWTTKLNNTTKGRRTAEEFIAFCRSVAEHHADPPNLAASSFASSTA